MAVSVFGNPITNTSLGKDVQKIDRAGAALKLKNPDGKEDSNLQHLEKLKAQLGSNIDAHATFCGVYNATGDAITFIIHHDWAGHNLSPYPKEIANGQWGVFLHGTQKQLLTNPSAGSVGAVVYRVSLIVGGSVDCVLAWNNRNCPCSRITAYTEIRNAGHYSHPSVWDEILKKLEKSGPTSHSEYGGVVSDVKIQNGIFEAVIKHKIVN